MKKLPCVMLVDDDETTNFLNKSLLARLNVAERVLVAERAEEALDNLRTHCQTPTPSCPVLILLDINMPGMNGFQFLEAYHQMPLAQQEIIVVVMVTSSLHPNDVARVQELNAHGLIHKPLTAEKMGALLRQYFPETLAES